MSKKKALLLALAATTLTTAVQPALASKEDAGTVIGSILGGILGHSMGDSENGRRNGAIIGSLLGGFLGNRIGKDMDDADRRAYQQAQKEALESSIGETIEWEGSEFGGRTGATGQITSTGEGTHKRTGQYCRAYQSDFRLRSGSETTNSAACLDQNGNWYDVKASEVNWNTASSDDGSSLPGADGQVQSNEAFSGGTLVSRITKKSGGEWIRIQLRSSSILEKMHLDVRDANLRIHEVIVVTRQGTKIPVNFAGTNGMFSKGSVKALDLRRVGVSTSYIEIRAESYSGIASMKVLLQDIHGDEVQSRAQRFN